MKNKNLFIGSISAFAGILLVILLLIHFIVVQDFFLKYTNNKYHVYENLSMSASELDKVTEQMVAYVKGEVDSPQITVKIGDKETEFFNKKELGHLLDVRELISKLYVFMVLLFVICIAGGTYLIKKKAYDLMAKSIYLAWVMIVLVAAGIGITALVDINLVIDGFHKAFLGDSSWVLNPSLDRSVWMFMKGMYQDVLVVIGLIIAVVCIVSISGAVIVKKRVLK